MTRPASRFAAFLAVAACSCAGSSSTTPPGNIEPNPDAPFDAPLGTPDARVVTVPRDGGSGSVIFDPCVADPLPGYDPVAAGLTACCEGVGPSHCVPKGEIIQRLVDYLAPCPGGDSVCMPDPIVRGGGRFRPTDCTSSVVHAPG